MAMLCRRLLLTALASACIAAPALAQLNPQRPITFVVSVAAGGGVDTIARVVAEKLPERLKQPVVVENRVGAGGVIGADSVAKAAPDGHTIMLQETSTVIHKWLHKSVPFDAIADFTQIAMVATSPLILFAHPSLPANDVKGLIAQAKANPGKLSSGAPGIGTPHHLALLMMNAAAGTDITFVPYRGTAPGLNDLIGGQIPLLWATPIAVMPHVTAGRVKALGTASAQRVALLPDVPTIAENALPGFNVDIWFGISAPAKTSRDVIERLAAAIRDVVELPDVQKRMQSLGFEPDYRGPNAFRSLVTIDHERYGKVIRDAGIQPN
jgi:tripartite-type tricarboxylate transporter receptor subunit TctC